MEHEIYVSREVKNLGHREAASLIKKAAAMRTTITPMGNQKLSKGRFPTFMP